MPTAQRRGGSRAALIDAGFGFADRVQQRGLTSLAARTRAMIARLGADSLAVEVDGVTVGGWSLHHGRYLRLLLEGGLGSPLFHLGVFEQALSNGMLVVDCGAHIGLHTVVAAHRVGPRGRVIALEPDPVNLGALRDNVEANGVADRVEIVEAAASDHRGSVRLHLDSNLDVSMRATSSIDPLGGFPDAVRDRVEGSGALHSSVEVPCVALDGVIAGRRVDVAKIDVEGAEAAVLRGMADALRHRPGPTLFIECHPASLARAGVSPAEWLAGLRDAGSLRLVDESRRQVLPASAEDIARQLEELGEWPFNVLWSVGE